LTPPAAARRSETLEDILAAANAGPAKAKERLIVFADGLEGSNTFGSLIARRWLAGRNGVGGSQSGERGIDDTVAAGFGGALSHSRWLKVTNLARAMEEVTGSVILLIGKQLL